MRSLWGRQSQEILKAALANSVLAREFLATNLAWLVLILAGQKFGLTLWAMLLGVGLSVGGAALMMRREMREGLSLVRSRRRFGTCIGLGLLYGLLTWAVLTFLPFWIALPLSLLAWLGVLAAYLYLNVLRQLRRDLGGLPLNDLSPLYEQVRQMRDLDEAASQLEARLRTNRDLDQKRDLIFYLAWANTFRGHLLLPTGLWNEASTYYQAALKLDPTNLAARVCLTLCYLHQGQFELAPQEIERAVAIFNGQSRAIPGYDEALWNWHRNEVSSEYEQSAGLFQLCALAIGLLYESGESSETKGLLTREFTAQALQIPGRSQAELTRLMSFKGGSVLGALQILAVGFFRPPAQPLDFLQGAVRLPLLPTQTLEDIERAA